MAEISGPSSGELIPRSSGSESEWWYCEEEDQCLGSCDMKPHPDDENLISRRRAKCCSGCSSTLDSRGWCGLLIKRVCISPGTWRKGYCYLERVALQGSGGLNRQGVVGWC